MKFKNETSERIKFPLEGPSPDWMTVRPGEEAEIEDEKRALAWGLTEVKEVETKEVKEEVKAETSSIGKTKVETKKRKIFGRRKK